MISVFSCSLAALSFLGFQPLGAILGILGVFPYEMEVLQRFLASLCGM